MQTSLPGFLFFLCLMQLVVAFGLVLRIYLFWGKMGSLASRMSMYAFVGYAVFILAAQCTQFWTTTKQMRILAKYGEDHVQEHLIDQTYLKLFFAESNIYTVELFLLDFSFIGYYYDLSNRLTRNVRRFLHALTLYSVTAVLVNFILLWTLCLPLKLNWSVGPDNCAPLNHMFGMTFLSFTHLLSDLGVFMMPILIIPGLQLGSHEKGAIFFALVIGATSIVASIVRFALLCQSYLDVNASPRGELEAINAINVWSNVQVFFAFFAFLLPTLRTAFRRRYGGSSIGSGRGGFVPGVKGKNGSHEDAHRLNIPIHTTITVASQTEGADDHAGSETELRPYRQPWEGDNGEWPKQDDMQDKRVEIRHE